MAQFIGVQAQREKEGGGKASYTLNLDQLAYAFIGNSSNGKAFIALVINGADKPFFLFDDDRHRVETYLEEHLTDISPAPQGYAVGD